MPSWVTWVLVGLAAIGLFFVWQNLNLSSGGPAVVAAGQKLTQSEFSKQYENLVAQFQRAYAQVGQDFAQLLTGVGGLTRRLELQARVVDDWARRQLIAREVQRRQIVIAPSDIDDQTEIEWERILNQNRLTEAQAAQILQQQGSSVTQFKSELRQVLALRIQTERLREQVVGPIQPSDAELADYLEKNREKYDKPEQVRARHILIQVKEDAAEADIAKAKQQIEQIRQELEAGADFAELAKKYSQDPGSAENGGDLEWFERDQMVKEFEEAAFALEAGQISEPVRTQFGFHLIKVEEKRPAERPALTQVREPVLKDYVSQEKDKRFEAWYRELQAQAQIAIGDPLLKIYYLLEREQKLDEALRAYEKLQDVYQKAHLARVRTKQLPAATKDPQELNRRKEEIVQLWLAQMVELKNLAERTPIIAEIAELRPNEIPARAFFQTAVLGSSQDTVAMITALQQRLQSYGVRESAILLAGEDQLVMWLRLPEESSVGAVERLLGIRGRLELKRVLKQGTPGEELQATGLGQQALKDRAAERYFLVVERPVVAKLVVSEAQVQGNPAARPAGPLVRLRLAESTVQELAQALTAFSENELLAIVVDGVVYGTMPVTSGLKQLLAQKGSVLDLQIEDTVAASMEEAGALALVLQSGPLPAPVRLSRP